MNANGNLVNSAGYYLMAFRSTRPPEIPLGSVPQVLQFNNNFIPAVETTEINYHSQPAGKADCGHSQSEQF